MLLISEVYNKQLDFQGHCCGGSASGAKCCVEANNLRESQSGTIEGSSVLFDSSKFIPLDPTQEVIFPPALKVSIALQIPQATECTSLKTSS